jgi:hypothetical protein
MFNHCDQHTFLFIIDGKHWLPVTIFVPSTFLRDVRMILKSFTSFNFTFFRNGKFCRFGRDFTI